MKEISNTFLIAIIKIQTIFHLVNFMNIKILIDFYQSIYQLIIGY